mmetsp:Transcript_95378/g.269954  ORF Transcript_95378/g.269954 Transcript_95378/m.269954 type:complete len:267 (-) Transcript_95378:560-1360(-)
MLQRNVLTFMGCHLSLHTTHSRQGSPATSASFPLAGVAPSSCALSFSQRALRIALPRSVWAWTLFFFAFSARLRRWSRTRRLNSASISSPSSLFARSSASRNAQTASRAASRFLRFCRLRRSLSPETPGCWSCWPAAPPSLPAAALPGRTPSSSSRSSISACKAASLAASRSSTPNLVSQISSNRISKTFAIVDIHTRRTCSRSRYCTHRSEPSGNVRGSRYPSCLPSCWRRAAQKSCTTPSTASITCMFIANGTFCSTATTNISL